MAQQQQPGSTSGNQHGMLNRILHGLGAMARSRHVHPHWRPHPTLHSHAQQQAPGASAGGQAPQAGPPTPPPGGSQ